MRVRRGMKFSSIFLLIVVFLLVLTSFQVVEVAAAGDVKFRGIVLTDEDIAFPICYFMSYCYVLVEEILHDPQDLVDLGFEVSVCYPDMMNLTVGERVEVYGFFWIDGMCPMQLCGHVVCESEYDYYVKRLPPVGGYSVPMANPPFPSSWESYSHVFVSAIALATAVSIFKVKHKRKQRDWALRRQLNQKKWECAGDISKV